MFEIVVEKSFSAAHFLPSFPGKCQRLHGHNYRVRAFLRGDFLDESGMLADFGAVKEALAAVVDRYDHYCLNEVPDFEAVPPSTENVARRIGEALAQYDFGPARLHRVEVWETPIQAAAYFLP
jgi:6-pyruvoyltetrahydropterin/6-carboxytetrahydropterin synthase